MRLHNVYTKAHIDCANQEARRHARHAGSAEASQARDQINMRVPVKERELIDRAAEATGKTRSDFMLDAARQVAEAVLLDRGMFLADESDYRKFVDLLDAPPERNEKLRDLLATEAPWKE